MSRTTKHVPREASKIFDVKTDKERLLAFSFAKEPNHEILAKMYFAEMKRKGCEF